MILLLYFLVRNAIVQESNVNINALIEETQRMSQKTNQMTFVWWIPEEFWRISFAQEPTIPKYQIEEFITVLRPYLIFIVVDGKIGTFGGITYTSESTIRNDIFLIKLGDNEFKWKLPLSSLFPPIICEKCKQKCLSTWNYCPWCGTKLLK